MRVTIPVYKQGKHIGEWELVERKPATVTLEHGVGTYAHTKRKFSLRDGKTNCYGVHIIPKEALRILGRGPLKPLKPRKVKPKAVASAKQRSFGWE